MRPALVAVAAITSLAAAPAVAQQVLETDSEAGRMVIGGPFRAISTPPYKVGISEDARILYLLDLEEPQGVMAFSLETGELVRTVPIQRVVRVYDVAARVSLVPFRRMSGDPCPGMFPSLDAATEPSECPD